MGSCHYQSWRLQTLSVSQQRLLFTLDGTTPFKFKSTDMSDGRVLVVQRQVVMGLLYMFLLQTSDTEHRFAVSRDRNLRYHVFEHTALVDGTANRSSVAACLECGSGGDAAVCRAGGRILAGVPPPQFFHMGAPSTPITRTLQVVSYNIWNVNSVEDRGDDYETRLQRMKKVQKSALLQALRPPLHKEHSLSKETLQVLLPKRKC